MTYHVIGSIFGSAVLLTSLGLFGSRSLTFKEDHVAFLVNLNQGIDISSLKVLLE